MTVSRRKDTGQWVTDFYHNGERIRKSLKFVRTKKEAEAAEAVIMNQVFQQVYGFEPKSTKLFEDFVVESFLPYSEANKKSFSSDVYLYLAGFLFSGKDSETVNTAVDRGV